MTGTQSELEKNFDIWYVNKSSPTIIALPTGSVVSAAVVFFNTFTLVDFYPRLYFIFATAYI